MELTTSLQSIGLTDYESRVYLSLLKSYPATGYQISKHSGVPRSMVYEVLARLVHKGFILESTEERSTYYRPLPPDTLLETHLSSVRSTIEELKPRLVEIYQIRDDHRFWSLTDIDAIYSYAGELLSSISQQGLLMVNDVHIEALDQPLAEIAGTSSEIQILQTGTLQLPFSNITRHPPLESRLQQITDTMLIIADNREVMLAETGPSPSATITNNPGFTMIARQFFWMEIFAQRIITKLGDDFISRLDPSDQAIVLSQIHQDTKD